MAFFLSIQPKSRKSKSSNRSLTGPAIESLEQRLVFSTLTINTLLDNTASNAGLSLREAVLLITNGGDPTAALGRSLSAGEAAQIDSTTHGFGTSDTIVFDSSIAGQTITLNSALAITNALSIDGGSSGMTLDGASGNLRAFTVSSTGNLSLNQLTVSHFNLIGGSGGAINVAGGTLAVSNSTFSNNTATGNAGSGTVGIGSNAEGGAIQITSAGTLTIDHSTFSSNAATGGSANATSTANGGAGLGGAIAVDTATATVTATTFTSNAAGGGATNSGSNAHGGASQGGAIYVTTAGTLTVLASTFSANTATGGTAGGATVRIGGNAFGGAVSNQSSTFTLTDSTLYNNTSAGGTAVGGSVHINGTGFGGGMYMASSTTTINFATLSSNNATTGRQIRWDASSSTLTISNSIIGQADASQVDFSQNGSGTLSGSNNLVRNTNATGFGVISTADPLLNTLADNGGPTQTMSLQNGSPALDAAGSAGGLITDQRGAFRTNNSVADLGALETFTDAYVNPPTLSTGGHATAVAGQAVSYTFHTSSAPTAALTETGSLPAGLTFTDNNDGTATVAGTVDPSVSGAFSISVTANNPDAPTVSKGFILTVLQQPAFTSVNHATFAAGTPGSFTVTTSGLPIAALNEVGTLPSGLTFTDNNDGTATITGTASAGDAGDHVITLAASNGAPVTSQTFTITVTTISATPIITGATDGSGDFDVANLNGTDRFTITNPFTGVSDPTRVASGDITGDGVSDIILAAGKGGHSTINIYNGVDGTLVHSFAAFSRSFNGTVYVASADVNHDGIADIVVGKGYEKGSNASFKVFNGADYSLMANITAFGSSSDARVAAGDLDGDGFAEVAVMQGGGKGASLGRVFSGAALATGHVNVLITTTPFGSSYNGGGFVTIGDVNHDGTLDVIVSRKGATQTTITVYSGATATKLTTFSTASTTGGMVAAHDVNNDGYADIFVGVTDSTGKHVKVFSGVDNTLLQTIDLNNSASLFVG